MLTLIIGIDMGGTHIDGVVLKDYKLIKIVKKPIDTKDRFLSIWQCLEDLLFDLPIKEIKRINLSTTISTNAIVEDKLEKVAMVLESGPGLDSSFLACGQENFFIKGYIDHRGHEVEGLDTKELKAIGKDLEKKGYEHYGIVGKFSTRNPHHEEEIQKLLNHTNVKYMSLGHRMSGNLNFPRRVWTSYLNSAVYKSFKDFADNIEKAIKRKNIKAPIYILKADGGTMDLKSAKNLPVESILSGPSASFMGIKAHFEEEDEDCLYIDIGGTTTDIFFLADGQPLFQPQGIDIGTYKTQIRALYSKSIGLGGDSVVQVKDTKLKIGPQRLGPAYAFNGPSPTPTDAMIYLGLMEGNMDRASEAMKKIGQEVDLTPKEVSIRIIKDMAKSIKDTVDQALDHINSQPVYTVKEVLEDKKVIPKKIYMIGGPAKVMAPYLEEAFSLKCSYPKTYAVANAIGAGLSQVTKELNLLADSAQGFLQIPELGIRKTISSRFHLEEAKNIALESLKEVAKDMGVTEDLDYQIIEANSFNMVRGFYTTGKNIRVKAQIMPKLISRLEDDFSD